MRNRNKPGEALVRGSGAVDRGNRGAQPPGKTTADGMGSSPRPKQRPVTESPRPKARPKTTTKTYPGRKNTSKNI